MSRNLDKPTMPWSATAVDVSRPSKTFCPKLAAEAATNAKTIDSF